MNVDRTETEDDLRFVKWSCFLASVVCDHLRAQKYCACHCFEVFGLLMFSYISVSEPFLVCFSFGVFRVCLFMDVMRCRSSGGGMGEGGGGDWGGWGDSYVRALGFLRACLQSRNMI